MTVGSLAFDGQYAIKEAGCGYVDHIEAVQLVSSTSMSPILRQILDGELTLLSEMIHWLELGPRVIKQTRVGSIALQVPKNVQGEPPAGRSDPDALILARLTSLGNAARGDGLLPAPQVPPSAQ